MTKEKKILITTSSFGKVGNEPLEKLKTAGYSWDLNPYGRKLTEDEAIDLLGYGYVGLIAGVEPLTKKVLSSAQSLKAISRVGTGMDSVDQEAARDLGIAVSNTPNAHVDAVAEITLAGMLDVLRNISLTDAAMQKGEWKRPMGRLLRGKTVGLIGCGRVARALISLLSPFGVTVLAYDISEDKNASEKLGFRYAGIDEVLKESDIVSLHLAYSPEVRHIIGAPQLALMKKDSILVNASRGGLIDELALAKALETGQLSGAYLDTFEQEPYNGPLKSSDSTVLTPHIGGYASEARLQMETEAVDNLLGVLESGA